MDIETFLHGQMMQGQGGDPAMSEAASNFFSGHTIQQNAMDTFNSLSPQQQQLVMDAGSLTDARDPTAVLISRCVKAKHGSLQAVQYRPGDWKCTACGEINFARNDTCRKCGSGRDTAAAPLDPQAADALAIIEDYLSQHPFEERAKETFRSLPPNLMQIVMDAGSFADARDPTAVLVSRINKAKQGMLQSQQFTPGDWNCPSCGHHNFSRNQQCRQCGTPNQGGNAMSYGNGGGAMAVPRIVPMGGAGPQKRWAEPQQYGYAPQAKARRTGDIQGRIQQYFLTMGIQQHAIDQFFTLQPASQTAVMDAGPLESARDPTAVLISRMVKFGSNQPVNPMHMQNKMVKSYSSSSADPEAWLSQYPLEIHAADQFRQLPPNLQRLVMDAGSLADARDPSAVLISRMSKAKSGVLQPLQTMPGDWNCPVCGEHNFARNSTCRKCGTSNNNLK